jgi:hypothetical protein
MAEESSENENKVFTMTVTRPWKSGRGEVLLAKLVTSPAFPFLL